MKLFGFTLSEVLIALVIIGIVAAISVPVIHSTQDLTERVSRINNTYSILSSAVDAANGYDAALGYGTIGSASSTDTSKKWFNTFLKPYLQTTKICYDTKGCWNSAGKVLAYSSTNKVYPTSNNAKGMGTNCVSAILNDGTFISVNIGLYDNIKRLTNYEMPESPRRNPVYIYFDINGDRGPNMMGEDIFVLFWNPYTFELMPAFGGSNSSDIDKSCGGGGDTISGISTDGYSCIMKYLKT